MSGLHAIHRQNVTELHTGRCQLYYGCNRVDNVDMSTLLRPSTLLHFCNSVDIWQLWYGRSRVDMSTLLCPSTLLHFCNRVDGTDRQNVTELHASRAWWNNTQAEHDRITRNTQTEPDGITRRYSVTKLHAIHRQNVTELHAGRAWQSWHVNSVTPVTELTCQLCYGCNSWHVGRGYRMVTSLMTSRDSTW